MILPLTAFADIVGGNGYYHPSPSISSTDNTLLITAFVLAAVSIISNIVLIVLLVRAKKAQRSQADLDNKSDNVTRSAD